MFLILLFALLCTAPLSLVKWHHTNYYGVDDDDDDDDDDNFDTCGDRFSLKAWCYFPMHKYGT